MGPTIQPGISATSTRSADHDPADQAHPQQPPVAGPAGLVSRWGMACMAAQIDHLLALANGDSDAARWLSGAITKMLQGEGWIRATGIQPSAVAKAIRDQHLRHAAELLGNDAIELHRLAGRFESAVWPRWRRSGIPADAGPVNRALYQARQAAPLPTSSRQFRRIARTS